MLHWPMLRLGTPGERINFSKLRAKRTLVHTRDSTQQHLPSCQAATETIAVLRGRILSLILEDRPSYINLHHRETHCLTSNTATQCDISPRDHPRSPHDIVLQHLPPSLLASSIGMLASCTKRNFRTRQRGREEREGGRAGERHNTSASRLALLALWCTSLVLRVALFLDEGPEADGGGGPPR